MSEQEGYRGAARRRVAVFLLLCLASTATVAEQNIATGDVAGDPSALADSAAVELFSTGTQLAVIKRAFAGGTAVPDASVLPRGSVIKFLIYINNDSLIDVHDVSIRDVLDPAFTYTSGSIKIDNTISCSATACTGAEELAIFNAVDDNTAATDAAASGDPASLTAGPPNDIVDAGDAVVPGNDQLDILAGKVWALLFTVEAP